MGRIFVGYAATWDAPNRKRTMYSSGCFSRSIAAFQAGMNIPVLLGHTVAEPLASGSSKRERRPIGKVLVMRQDSVGLEITGVLEPVDDLQGATIDKMLHHQLGLSLGSWSHESKWIKQSGPFFMITDCLIYEISLTTLPAGDGGAVFIPAKRIENDPVPMSGEESCQTPAKQS